MMTLNKESLDAATQARDALLEREHAAERARVDYHHSIRRLHADGASLREIAGALGMSHQRVHQIVDPGGEAPPGPRGPRGRGGPGRGPGHGPRHGHHGPGPRHPGGGPEGPGGGFPDAMRRLKRRMESLVSLDRFADDARRAVQGAVEAAEELGHPRVGSEHLLIGVASAGDGSRGADALAAAGLTRDDVVRAVDARLVGDAGGPGRRRPFTPAARRVLEASLRVAHDERADSIDAGHILRALIDDIGDAAAVLGEAGADREAILTALGGAS